MTTASAALAASEKLRTASENLTTLIENTLVSNYHLVSLTRPPEEASKSSTSNVYGFTIRGGVEHGLGHFVSAVEAGSEANAKGVRPGDQVV